MPSLDMQTVFYPDGTRAAEGPSRQGARHGAWTLYRPDGSRLGEGEYRDGRMHGAWRVYRAGGLALRERSYRDEKAMALWIKIEPVVDRVPFPAGEVRDRLARASADLAADVLAELAPRFALCDDQAARTIDFDLAERIAARDAGAVRAFHGDLWQSHADVPNELCPLLRASAATPHLRSLGLEDPEVDERGLAPLFALALPALRRLVLRGPTAGADIDALVAAPLASRLCELVLEDHELGPEALCRLGRTPGLGALRRLELTGSGADESVIEALARGGPAGSLRTILVNGRVACDASASRRPEPGPFPEGRG